MADIKLGAGAKHARKLYHVSSLNIASRFWKNENHHSYAFMQSSEGDLEMLHVGVKAQRGKIIPGLGEAGKKVCSFAL